MKYKLGWEWDIRNIVRDAEPKWHSGVVTLIKGGKSKQNRYLITSDFFLVWHLLSLAVV